MPDEDGFEKGVDRGYGEGMRYGFFVAVVTIVSLLSYLWQLFK